MKKHTFIIALFLLSTHVFSQIPKKSESVLVNGKSIYYEIHGNDNGNPLFLLHGYSLSSKSWFPYVNDFEDDYEVYLIDLTGHGKSENFKDDLSIKSMAEDLNSLVQYLKLS